MIKSITRKANYINSSFIFILLIFAGRGSSLVRSIETWESISGVAFILISTTFFAIYHHVKLNNKFIFLLIGFSIYFILLSVKFTAFHLRFFSIYMCYFYITYVTIQALRHQFFLIFENVLVQLCKISLGFWIILIISPSFLKTLFDSLSFLTPGADGVYSNIFIYTINTADASNAFQFTIANIKMFRNAGFSWEPGGYAVLINLGMFINLVRTRFRFKNNINFFVFLISLISTFSTTGYGIFMLLLLFFLYIQKYKFKVLLFPIITILAVYLLTLPFMLDKLVSVSEHNTEGQIESSILYGTKQTPQRLASFVIDFQDFKNNPILGYGGHQEERWTNKLGANISTISGIGKIFACFGIFGSIFFFCNLYKSSKLLAGLFNFKAWAFPFLMILMISISYSLIFNPILMCFWMLAFFLPEIKPSK